MKRPYQSVNVEFVETGWQLLLDGKPAITPLKSPILLPSENLARMVASEWEAQGEKIDKTTMPFTGYASVAIDIVPKERAELTKEMLRYAETDLLCYRSEEEKFAIRQAEKFTPLIRKLESAYELKLNITSGVMPVAQPEKNQAIIAEYAGVLGDFHFAGLMVAMQTLGSIFLAMLLTDGHADADAVFAAARLDETMQAEVWGITENFVLKQEQIQNEVRTLKQFFVSLQ